MLTKGLLLCAGMGSRLRPITYTSAKHVLPVANKPLIHYTIEMLHRAGITEIGIVVGVNRHEIEGAVGDGSRWDVKVDYIVQDNPLGTAHAVSLARDWAAGAPFLMVLGDILVENGINSVVEAFAKNQPASVVVLHKTENPRQFGIAEIENGRIVGLEEKPESPKSNLAVAGIYVFQPCIFDVIGNVKPSLRGELELPDALRELIARNLVVQPLMLEGWWKDTGRPEDMIDLNRLLLEKILEASCHGNVDGESSVVGRVVIESSAIVERSIIRGPVIVGPGSTIRDAYIGPYTSIGPGVTIEGSEVEYSIIMEKSVISGIKSRIGSSLIGKNVRITHERLMPSENRFVLGDSSLVNFA
ncbi:MAG TPA: glucose-1-phosphate thymidylyltransferase [Candidatus Latescibacteria bacterium]|nr:glucose-1-phosphate thymidylyltransferase [Candidatus Latescibacterota bacterium]HRS94675.1 glucose-1-phosphate thymidylyltransferase [Candidatus Latescibacterota bacterium]